MLSFSAENNEATSVISEHFFNSKDYSKPELLAPAGDLEKLKTAITFGANAVYIGGQSFGLRAKAKNFTDDEMADGISFAHEKGAKVYVTANIFAHNSDFDKMAEFFYKIQNMGADALIISDPGIFSLAREVVPDMDIHISTQANVINHRSVNFWRCLGARRVVLARELSIDEIKEIRDNIPSDFEIETFVHGAMCISYSGRCLLSNYLSNRDSNRGECSQPCRWSYDLDYALRERTRPEALFPIEEDERGTYILNSRDLCVIDRIPELVAAGINSFKLEGRMKSSYYVATTVKAYREAIDDFFISPHKYEEKKKHYLTEVQKNSHRQFTSGFYFSKPGPESQVYESSAYIKNYDFVGMVTDYNEHTGLATIEQRNKFAVGEQIEILRSNDTNFTMTIRDLYDETGLPIKEAPHPQQILKLWVDKPVKKYDMLRKEKS